MKKVIISLLCLLLWNGTGHGMGKPHRIYANQGLVGRWFNKTERVSSRSFKMVKPEETHGLPAHKYKIGG